MKAGGGTGGEWPVVHLVLPSQIFFAKYFALGRLLILGRPCTKLRRRERRSLVALNSSSYGTVANLLDSLSFQQHACLLIVLPFRSD